MENSAKMPKIMPNAEEIEFKDNFIERYKTLTDFDEFKKYSLSFLRRSIRVNTLKIAIKELKQKIEKSWKLEQIPWCTEGFWISNRESDRRDIGNMIEHALGYFYVQEAASMIPALALEPKPHDIVLDMCASPGSKTTQIAQYMKNKGVLIANDYKIDRMKPLVMNLQRCGVSNAATTMMEGRFFRKSGIMFDKILVDAPCSGTGTIRKSLKTLRIYNPDAIKRLSGTQKQLLETAFELLKHKGTLVYSTCSLEPDENEAVVSYLINKYENARLDDIDLKLKRSHAVLEFENQKYNDEVKKCLRIWPQDNDTEGFFVAKLRKE